MKKVILVTFILFVLFNLGFFMPWNDPMCGFMESRLPCSRIESLVDFYFSFLYLVIYYWWLMLFIFFIGLLSRRWYIADQKRLNDKDKSFLKK